ncbi:Serine protease, subtilase family [Alloactinosynnema sp. L-07]|uniref:S8 family serine peptidase n=1 Tax=Alloactinosynnema sp. L-07 TaxID=1653480 RepID=UPI00065EFBD9|nr:S8 family serine peptidase [Alloactinosynnema sp. L-07]CRK61404.1 Serine protease, subtilase family [Alloactinosynnema sp. L-07]
MRRSRCARAAVLAMVLPISLVTSGGEAVAAPTLGAEPLTPADRVTADKSPTSRLAKTDASLLGRTDAMLIPVVIKLDYDSLATYAGGRRGLEATSPSVTGKKLKDKTAAQQKYEAFAAGQEQAFKAELATRAPQAAVGTSLRVVYGGVSARVPANKISDILAIPNVVAVQADDPNHLLTDSSPDFIGAPSSYNRLGTTAGAGTGVLYGNLDSGVWPEHPSFADLGNLAAPPGPARVCDYGDNPLTPANDPFACQRKLVGGAAFTQTYDLVLGDDVFAGTARDSNGHGTHTASTSAGNIVNNVSVLGRAQAPIHGIAPGAWVMEYKVCGPQGCFPSDTTAAVGQAILDGVDVINYSISGGEDPFTDPTELAFLDAYAAGLFVAASAGNSGPAAGTSNHLSPWVTTVAASTQRREFASTLTITADNGDTFTADGASITPGAGPAQIVLASAAPYSNALCTTPAPAGLFTGKIVACQRGPGRVAKGFNVLQGGAAGMVLFNPSRADALTDTHWLPAVHLPDGTSMLAFLGSHTGETARFTAGQSRSGQGDVMAAFSSRGPGGNFIKPDVTAPGVQILAGDTPIVESVASGPGGELFQAIAGTSMSSPHTAGAAILLKAINPGWTPGQIKSGLMSTATTAVVKEDRSTPADPFDMGSGRIDLRQAWAPGITFDETAANMALLANDPVNAVHLNVPSVNTNVMPGRLTTVRTAKNVSGLKQKYTVSTTAPAGAKITVLPKKFSLDPGQSAQLSITIESQAPAAQFFGQIRLVPDSPQFPALHLPVAFKTGQSHVTLASECAPTQIAVNATSTCTVTATNTSFTDTTVDLTTRLSNQLKVVSASNATVVDKRTVHKTGVTVAGALPGVPSVDAGELFGYIPLTAFGVTPVPIGDEEIINFNVPAFVYNGVTYSRVGVDSNGYLVVGGGTADDNNCCSLPTGPSPARPNNILAPFWTDLDGTGAPGVYAAVLTDGVNSWLVFEYRVNVFGTTSGRTFQVWIGVNGTQDITFAYNPAALPADPGQPFLVGAENEFGGGDIAAVLPTDDLRVTSTVPVPGASVSYTVTVVGTEPGAGRVTTEMTGAGLPGTTVVTSVVAIE